MQGRNRFADRNPRGATGLTLSMANLADGQALEVHWEHDYPAIISFTARFYFWRKTDEFATMFVLDPARIQIEIAEDLDPGNTAFVSGSNFGSAGTVYQASVRPISNMGLELPTFFSPLYFCGA